LDEFPAVVGKTHDVKKIPVRTTVMSAMTVILYVSVAAFSAGKLSLLRQLVYLHFVQCCRVARFLKMGIM
jgi:hypothetical protein